MTTSLRDRLIALPKDKGGVLDLFRDLRGEPTVGFNHDLVKKVDCVDRLLATYSAEAIEAAIVRVTGAAPAPAQAEVAPAPVAPVAPAPVAPAPVAPVHAVDQQAIAGQIAGLFAALAGSAVNEDRVRSIVDEIIAQRVPRAVEIRRADAEPVRVEERVHPAFDKVVKLASAGVNVLLVGPAGCGKTHLAHQVAKALGKTFASISGSAGVSESQLTGRLLPTGEGGRFEYTESPFVRQYRTGGVFLFDELDAFDPNCLLTVNQATANGGFEVEARAAAGLPTYVKRDEGSVLMGSANTFGVGAGAMYVGRAQLDAATLDRWFIVEMDYDREWESTIATERVCDFVWKLRDAIQKHRMRRVASTRMIQKASAALSVGLSWADVKDSLLAGWTAEERSKAGV